MLYASSYSAGIYVHITKVSSCASRSRTCTPFIRSKISVIFSNSSKKCVHKHEMVVKLSGNEKIKANDKIKINQKINKSKK